MKSVCCPQVIHGAHTAQVTLANNKKYAAQLKGAEPDKDLAGVSIRQVHL